MAIKVDEYNSTCVVTVAGDLSGTDVKAMSDHVEKALEASRIVDFVIDLEKCPFIDSEGLETLLWLRRHTENLHGQVRLAGLDDNLKTILDLTRLAHRFETHKDVTEALRLSR